MILRYFFNFEVIVFPTSLSVNKLVEEHIIQHLNDAYEVRVHDLNKSIEITTKALELSRSNEFPSLIAKSLSKLSLYTMIRGDHKKALDLSLEAISIFKSIDDECGIAEVNYSIAGIYYKSNNYHLGMVYLLDCLTTFRKFQDHHNESRTLKSLGTIYEFLSDYSNAKMSYEGAIRSAVRANDKNLESNAYNPLSGLLLKLDEIEKAMELIKRSIKLKKSTGDLRGIAFAMYGRGKVYLHLKQYEKAEKDLLEAIKSHEHFGEQLGKTMAWHKLAVLYMEMGRKEEAIALLERTIAFNDKNSILIINIKSNHFMYRIYKVEGNITKALYYLESFTKLKETIANFQTLKVIENYETAAKIKSSEREARLELEKSEIEAKQQRAEHLAEIKQEFLSAMSHEIRTPLNAVTSIISLLEDRSSEEDKKLLTSLRFSSKNLLRIIDDILDFSKLESNKMELEKHPVLFEELLDNIGQTYIGMAKEKGLTLNTSFDKGIAEAYLLDETRMFQILGNLLSNAVKYTEKGTVSLEVKLLRKTRNLHTLLFRVIDTGVGIAKKEQDKLFESFYMPTALTTRNLGGTGLGLAIVKKMVNLHGSTITIESELDRGSEFYFELDLEPTQLPIKDSRKLQQHLENKTAILAEDNEINAMVMAKLLEKSGIQLKRVTNGEEAVALAKEEVVDFILMDIHMPKLNGFEATQLIRSQVNPNQYTPIFALTADITAINEEEYSAYFDDFLRKPLQIDRLFDALLKHTQVSVEKIV